MIWILSFFGIIAVLFIISYITTNKNDAEMYVLRCCKCSVPNTHKFYGKNICERCLRKELISDK